MRILDKEGFILSGSAQFGEFSYVLLLNPHHVIRRLHGRGGIQRDNFLALMKRADEIGASLPIE